ncbi:MAG: DUF4157 domain-containing protein [Cyanophyceae cyanobacterium]
MPEEEELMMKPEGSLQREELPEEEELMMKPEGSLQREVMPEEEELMMKPEGSIQREEMPEEEELQMKSEGSIQREGMPEEEELMMKPEGSLQRKDFISNSVWQEAARIPSQSHSIQRQGEGQLPASAWLEGSISQSRGGGSSLPKPLKGSLEQAFKSDFSGVRVHTDGQADQMSRSIQAKAFTTGSDIFFRSGAYEPGSRSGQELLAHELTHVVQQSRGDLVQRDSSIQRDGPTATESEDQANKAKIEGETDKYLNLAKNQYTQMFERQKYAAAILKDTAGKEDPPPVWHSLLIAGVEVALVAATGGIGGAVSVAIAPKVAKVAKNWLDHNTMLSEIAAKAAADAAGKIVGDMAKDATKDVVKKLGAGVSSAVSSSLSEIPDSDPEKAAKAFFGAMEKDLIDNMTVMPDAVDNKRYDLKQQEIYGMLAAQILYESAKDESHNAEAVQRDKGIQEWAVYMAKIDWGSTQDGDTDASGTPRLIQDDRGILDLVGDYYSEGDLNLHSAKMEGMNEPLRKHIAQKSIKDLDIPIHVHLTVGPEFGLIDQVLGKKDPIDIGFSRNEKDTVWVNPDNPGLIHLAPKVGVPTQLNAGANSNWHSLRSEADAFIIIRKVFDKMGDKKPPL